MKTKLIFSLIVVMLALALPCQCSNDGEFLATKCNFVRKCLQERVWIAEESQNLRTVSTTGASASRVERLAERMRLYQQVCYLHMGDFLDFLKNPPGGSEALEKSCGGWLTSYREEMMEIVSRIPLAKDVNK